MPKKSRLAWTGCLVLFAGIAAASPPLVVHEWGTFTSFQDEQGRTISRINVDDEPVPYFVYRTARVPVLQTTSLPARWSQGAPSCYPGVTMRLETPVLYFYPPAGWQAAPFDVSATFVGGWLTEFYPAADSEGMNVQALLDAGARGYLHWHQVRLDPAQAFRLRNTEAHVWNAPRKVSAAIVTTQDSQEAEKFLFYRGVGSLDAPIVVRQEKGAVRIALRDDEQLLTRLPRLWLFEVRQDGGVQLATLNGTGRMLEAAALPVVKPGDKSGLVELRAELKGALTAQGLYEDEAEAMLETWRLSYFESPGLRLFFVLPQTWTDARLPLSISTPADITRVMVGRVELVSPQQRATLAKLHALTDAEFPAKPLYYEDPKVRSAWRQGLLTHADLYRSTNRPVPKSLELYESLGRFRDALLAHELQLSTNAAYRGPLQRVLDNYGACMGDVRVSEPVQTTKR